MFVAVRYGKRTLDNRSGLFITNEGEPAYDISIPDIQFGISKLVFHTGDFPRLVKSDGDHLCETWVEQRPGTGMLGDGLFDEMVSQGVDSFEIPIRYKDGDNVHYVRSCKLERDTRVAGGIAVRYLWQRLVGSPSETALSPDDPRVRGEVVSVVAQTRAIDCILPDH